MAKVVLGKSVLVSSIILNLSMRFKQFKEMVPLMGPPSALWQHALSFAEVKLFQLKVIYN